MDTDSNTDHIYNKWKMGLSSNAELELKTLQENTRLMQHLIISAYGIPPNLLSLKSVDTSDNKVNVANKKED